MSRRARPAARRLGAHMSIAGGLHRALERGAAAGCDVVQVFTKPNRAWQARELSDADLQAWFAAREATGVEPALAHASYLLNLASPDRALQRRSREALADELERCARLEIPCLVFHPGAHMGGGEAVGIARIVAAVDAVLADLPDCPTTLLFENTAGQGTNVGYRFEHLRDLVGGVRFPERVGICLDTCHALAGGYALATAADWERTVRELDRVVGLRWLKGLHLNDSKRPLGSRVDRHESIGRGHIGLHAFRCLLTHRRIAPLPMVLETPKPTPQADVVNLAVLRALAGRQRLTARAKCLAAQPLDAAIA